MLQIQQCNVVIISQKIIEKGPTITEITIGVK
jgi:hypothetical protein